jgi:hypothetical protein
MLAIDSSDDSKTALRAAAQRSWPNGTEFLSLSVIDQNKSTFIERLEPEAMRWFFEQAGNDQDLSERMLEIEAKPLRDVGYKVTCKVRTRL